MISFAGASNSTTTTAMTTTSVATVTTGATATTAANSAGMVTVIAGSVVLSVPNAQSFVQNQQALTAIATGIAQKAGVPGPNVAVRATVASSRRLGAAGRLGGAAPRLLQSTQNVNLDYRITPAAGMVAANIQSTMLSVNATGFQTLIQTALTQAGVPITVTVASVVVPSLIQVPGTTTMALTPTTTAKSTQYSAASHIVGSRGLALAVVMAFCTTISA